MKKKGSDLEFLSLIQRDGSTVIPVGKPWSESMGHARTDDVSYLDDAEFELRNLSLTEKTYIAFHFNVWIVKIKE